MQKIHTLTISRRWYPLPLFRTFHRHFCLAHIKTFTVIDASNSYFLIDTRRLWLQWRFLVLLHMQVIQRILHSPPTNFLPSCVFFAMLPNPQQSDTPINGLSPYFKCRQHLTSSFEIYTQGFGKSTIFHIMTLDCKGSFSSGKIDKWRK